VTLPVVGVFLWIWPYEWLGRPKTSRERLAGQLGSSVGSDPWPNRTLCVDEGGRRLVMTSLLTSPVRLPGQTSGLVLYPLE